MSAASEMNIDVDEEIQDTEDTQEKPPSNLEQLQELQAEITHLVENGITPYEEEWYEDRFKYIQMYSYLNWEDFYEKFKTRDTYIHEQSWEIYKALNQLLEEYSIRPIFNFDTYCFVINSISELWHHYSTRYIDPDITFNADIVDITELMSFMKT